MMQTKFDAMLLGLVAIAALSIGPAISSAAVVYDSAPFFTGGGQPYNYVPLADDGTPNRPAGSVLGNTITLGGTERDLTTVTIGVNNGGGDGPWTLDIYGGSDPNTATLLGAVTASFGGGITPTALFDFTSQNIVLPNTITFTITSTAANKEHGPLSGIAPTVGTAPDAMWYGTVPGNFVSNTTWAIADGASTNLLTAQVNAVPEPAAFVMMSLAGLGLMGFIARRRKQQEL